MQNWENNFRLMKEKNRIKGDVGESQAYIFLKNNKFKILEQNYKNKIGEIDIIAEKGNKIYFIEVKKRSSLEFGYPCEAVNYYKKQKIKKVAQIYIMKNHVVEKEFQFSVIELLDDKLNFIENIF